MPIRPHKQERIAVVYDYFYVPLYTMMGKTRGHTGISHSEIPNRFKYVKWTIIGLDITCSIHQMVFRSRAKQRFMSTNNREIRSSKQAPQ